MRSVLFVCRANICRSPFAERLLAWTLPDLPVRSAGVTALDGAPMDPLMGEELRRRGIEPGMHRARQLMPADLDADLILVMSRAHRTALLEERPDAVDRIGLLTGMPALAEQMSGRALTRGDVTRWARGSIESPGVRDPYGKGQKQTAAAAALIHDNIEILVDLIAPPELAVFIDESAPR